MNTRDNQRGGIVVFAVVGVLLVGLLAGALYLGKHQADIAKENTPAPVAIDTEKEATEAGKGATDTKKDQAENKPAPSPAKPSAPSQAPATSSTQTSTPSPATVPNSGPSQVASTGPVDTLLSVGVVTAVSFVGLAFVQSNARLRRSALNR